MSNTKKVLIGVGALVDVGATIFLFVVSIIMLVTYPANQFEDYREGFIGELQQRPTLYLLTCVLPLFLLLAFNVFVLVRYVKSQNAKKEVTVSDLTAEQKEALRRELLRDLQGGSTEPQQEEKVEE